MLTALPITSLYVGLFMLLLLALAFGVVRLRLSTHTNLGDGGHSALSYAIRSHGNATEYVPIMVLALALLELNGSTSLWLHLYGSGLLVARFCHAIGMQMPQKENNFRKIGIVFTWLIMLAMAIQLIASTF